MSGTAATFYGETVEGKATTLWGQVYEFCEQFHRFKIEITDASEQAEISYQQIKYWKGVLLPALAKDTGDCVNEWETRLKLAVMPDEFKPETVTIDKKKYTFIPSITKLSMKKLNALMEGSVSILHTWGFTWVRLPDSAMRKPK